MATAGRILIIPRGKYNEESTYNMLDMVSFGGKGWICKKTCIGIEPIEGEYWAECIDMSYEFEDLEKKSNPLKAVYIDEIDETLDSTTPEYPYIIGHSVMLEELGVGSLVSVEILSPSEDYICQNAVGETGTASRLYDSEKGWGEWFVNAIPKYDDITETTETTMPNSHEGILLFNEIGGKTEKFMTAGKNLIDFRKGITASGGGVTYTLQPDGSFKRTGTATSVAGNVWIMGGYNREPNETNTIFHLEAGETYVGSDCMFFSKDISFYLNPPTYIDPAKNPNGINITGIKNASFEVGKTYNDTVYPMLCKYSEDNEWEPYDGGTPKPFIRSARIRGIKTHDGNGNESSITFSEPIELNKVGDVQDVFVDGKITKRLGRIVFDGSDDEGWYDEKLHNDATKYRVLAPFSNYKKPLDADTVPTLLCDAYIVNTPNENYFGNDGITVGLGDGLVVVCDKNYNTSDISKWKAHLQANPITIVYELDTPITEAFPIADQVALNSLNTCDGVTYLEIDSALEPTFEVEYGTSKLGGYRLESLQMAKCNDIKISALETAMINNI